MSLLQSLCLGFSRKKVKKFDEETAPLLNGNDSISAENESPGTSQIPRYGSTGSAAVVNKEDQPKDAEDSTKMKKKKGWIAYIRRFAIFIPYIWPTNDRLLQLRLVAIFICIVAMRFFRVLAPYQLGVVINALNSSYGRLPVRELVVYLIFNWIESTGILRVIKGILWIPVEQNAHKLVTLAAYSHVMGMSCDFHDDKKSGELFKSIEQGTSIYTLLETVLFTIAPMLTDLVVACAYLSYLFGWQMSILVCTSTLSYLWLARYFTLRQADLHRLNTEADRLENQCLYDSVGCWLSVVYFNNFAHERTRYSEAIQRSLRTSCTLNLLYYFSSVVKESLLEIGYCGACFIAGYRVSHGTLEVGNFVVMLSYWSRFTGPLASFGWLQRSVQRNFIEAEKLLELLQTAPSVKDGQAEFKLGGGAIEFEGVNFSYDSKKFIIKELNFSASPGQKVALVGETGSGKSTILKLLFRFYDVSSGSVKVDGQDVRGVTLESFRQAIGVVPQVPNLFNDTVMNNVRYSKLNATDEEVMEACRAAAFHDKILTFTKDYETVVGENGVKLSGGEIQRIAIARAILKDPKIILLDEATSAVDSATEALIQQALRRLTQGRTTFVVAHRLSTVMDADIMLVIKEGSIVEQGSPKELLKSKGEFYDLWTLQNITTA